MLHHHQNALHRQRFSIAEILCLLLTATGIFASSSLAHPFQRASDAAHATETTAQPTTETSKSPHWDLSRFFPSFNDPARQQFRDQMRHDLVRVTEAAKSLPTLDMAHLASWEKVLREYEDLTARSWHYSTYIGCLTAEDANNAAYQAEAAEDAQTGAEMQKLSTQLKRGFRSADDAAFAALLKRPSLKGAEHYLQRLREDARRSMTPDLENLTSDLEVDGFSAWGRMYDQLIGKLEFDLVLPNGKSDKRPFSEFETLMGDPDPVVRQAAYTGLTTAIRQHIDPIAHALNHIAGWRLTLNQYRGIPDILDNALFEADIRRETLEAMFGALKKHIDIPRSMARLKARKLGHTTLAWQDFDAPLPGISNARVSWNEGREKFLAAFRNRLPDMADLFLEMEKNRFLETEIRTGKAPGAFCTDSPLTGESRIFMTYGGTLNDLYTLSHESGHAYNNFVMKDMRPFARLMPNTLAETASTFGELVFTHGLLADPATNDEQKARILNMEANNVIGYLLDVPCRYYFEKALYAERAKGEVGIERLQELMLAAQRETFGDTLDQQGNPWFWATKGHFYFTDSTFYNFPYTFGFLLSRGLMAEYKKQGAAFLPRYREFLRLSGSMTAEEVARRTIGVDLSDQKFWESAILSLQEFVEAYEKSHPNAAHSEHR